MSLLNPKNTPSMVMFAQEQETFIAKHLGPAFESRYPDEDLYFTTTTQMCLRIRCRFWAIRQRANMWMGRRFTPVRRRRGGVMTQVHDAYPKKNLYMTEQSVTARRGEGADWNCRAGEAGDDWRDAELEPQRAALEFVARPIRKTGRTPTTGAAPDVPGRSRWMAIL